MHTSLPGLVYSHRHSRRLLYCLTHTSELAPLQTGLQEAGGHHCVHWQQKGHILFSTFDPRSHVAQAALKFYTLCASITLSVLRFHAWLFNIWLHVCTHKSVFPIFEHSVTGITLKFYCKASLIRHKKSDIHSNVCLNPWFISSSAAVAHWLNTLYFVYLADNHKACLQFRAILDKSAINIDYMSCWPFTSGPRIKITVSRGRLYICLSFTKTARPLSKLIVSCHVPNKDVGEFCLFRNFIDTKASSPCMCSLLIAESCLPVLFLMMLLHPWTKMKGKNNFTDDTSIVLKAQNK